MRKKSYETSAIYYFSILHSYLTLAVKIRIKYSLNLEKIVGVGYIYICNLTTTYMILYGSIYMVVDVRRYRVPWYCNVQLLLIQLL